MRVSRIIVLFIFIFVSMTSCNLLKYKKKIKETKIENIDFTKVADGVYEGEYDVYLVNAKVAVKVKKGKVVDIELKEHKHGKGYSGEKLIDTIIEKQSLEIDSITGATGSSKTILKAVELALKK